MPDNNAIAVPPADKPVTQLRVGDIQAINDKQTVDLRAANNVLGLPSWAWWIGNMGAMGLIFGLYTYNVTRLQPAEQARNDARVDKIIETFHVDLAGIQADNQKKLDLLQEILREQRKAAKVGPDQ